MRISDVSFLFELVADSIAVRLSQYWEVSTQDMSSVARLAVIDRLARINVENFTDIASRLQSRRLYRAFSRSDGKSLES